MNSIYKIMMLVELGFNDTGQDSWNFGSKAGGRMMSPTAKPGHDLSNMKDLNKEKALPKYKHTKDAGTKIADTVRKRYHKKNMKNAPVGIAGQVYG